MKKSMMLLSLLLGGCVTAEKENKICTKMIPIAERKMECVGGRGVAAQICVEREVTRMHCVRWEQL